jgi:hypothetical protein
MADITLSTTESNIVVDASNNIIQVSSTPTTIVVGEGSTVDNAQIRAALSNVAPILYDAGTGVFSFDANATFSGKTTDDLAEGNVNLYFTNARSRDAISTLNQGVGYGTLSYSNTTGVITYNVVTNANIRGAISYAAGSAGYNSSTGVISIPATTTNLSEGTNLYFTAARARGNVSATDAGGLGSFSYNNTTGVFTYTGPSDSDVRSLISAANTTTGYGNITYSSSTGQIVFDRVTNSHIRGAISITDTGGDGSLTYNNGTGVITYTGPDQTEANTRIAAAPSQVRAHLSATNTGTGFGGIAYDNSTGVTTYTRVSNADIASSILNNTIKLKNYSETAVDYGNVAGNITVDLGLGSIHEYTLVGNVTFISFANAVAGSSATLIFKQDAVGGRQLDTTTHTWTGWKFAGNSKTLTLAANSKDVMTVIIPDTGDYYSSIVSMEGMFIPNSQLANSNVIVNGVTIALGSSGNIDTFNSNVTVNGNLNVAGNLNYQNVTDLYVTDQKITLNSNAATNANVEIISNRPTATNTMLKWNEPATRWEFTNDGSTYYPIATSTSDLVEGTNLYFTAARARGNISAAENITYNSSTGVIGLANSLANVSTITAQSGQNLTLNTASGLITKQKYNNVDVFSGNISSDGYALFSSNAYDGSLNYFNYTGNANIENFIVNTGNTTAGSNAITNVSLLNYFADTAQSLSSLPVGFFFSRDEFDYLPFPVGTRVSSVDSANSIVYMSANATTSTDLGFQGGVAPNGVFGFNSALYDSNTGLTIILISDYDTGGADKTVLVATSPYPSSRYGYPATGPAITDFDIVTAGTINDYSLGTESLAQFMIGRNKLSSPKSVLQAPRGLIVGEGADLTNRAENDMLPSFGLNVLWDGQSNIDDYGGNTPLTQLLIKNYTDNNLQGQALRTTFGPRLFFTAAEGNSSQPISVTYPKKNLELGRISWWSTSSTQAGLSTGGPPAWISGVTGQDCVSTNSGLGMYFGISPNTANFNRSLYMASSLGNTLIASAQDSTGTHRPIIFAPSHYGSSQGNSALLYNQTILGNETITDTIQTSGTHFAQINYNNATSLTGSKVAVTNGNNTNSTREGNIVLSIDRNYNSGNANVRVRTGGTNFYGANNPDRVRFTFAPQGLVDGTAVTIRNFVAGAATGLNNNVYYVKRNDSGGYIGFDLYYDSGLTSGVNIGTTNQSAGAGTFEYTRNNGVTAKDWAFTLPQGSNNLILTEDGVNTTTFESGGNVNVTGNINLTGRLLGYDRVYGEFCYTAGNIVPAAADTVYTFPFDTTNMASDVVANNTSRINIVKPGIFKLIMSLQVKNSNNSADHIMRFWLRKNGADVANSATLVTPLKLQESVISMDWMVESDGDDYWEIAYYVNSTNISFPNYTSISSPVTAPSCPPIIVNVIPVGA